MMSILFKLNQPIFNCTSYARHLLSTKPIKTVEKIDVKEEGNRTVVDVIDVVDEKSSERNFLRDIAPGQCSLCFCAIPMKVQYSDVLILEQFMREDGSVLPKQITGLCTNHQMRIERCIMQAFMSGLFPDKLLNNELDRSSYKRFNRYWEDDMDLYRLKKAVKMGSWYYIKRYENITGKDRIF